MTNPSRLCPEHQAEYDRWLDYRLPPASVRIISIGTGARDAAAASRAARFAEWRDTITRQQALIIGSCAQYQEGQ